MKKIVALLAGLTMMSGTIQMPVFAANEITVELPVCSVNKEDLPSFTLPMQKSDHPDYDLFKRENYTYLDEKTGIYSRYYLDIYFKFETETKGTRYEVMSEYSFVRVTTDDTVDLATIGDILGENVTDSEYAYYLGENQYMYKYQKGLDYSELYQIDGIKQVELVKRAFGCPFYVQKYYEDNNENGIVIEEATDEKIFIQDTIETDPDVELTPEMFADTGFNVVAVKEVAEDYWLVYYEYQNVDSYLEFDAAAQQIDGVMDAHFEYNCFDIAIVNLHFDAVEPAAKLFIGDNYTDEWLVGDLNLNNVIDLEEVVAFLECYAQTCAGLPTTMNGFDLNNDGRFDMFEVDYLMQCYAKSAAGLA